MDRAKKGKKDAQKNGGMSCANFLKIWTNFPDIYTNFPKLVTSFRKIVLKNLVRRFSTIFGFMAQPLHRGFAMILTLESQRPATGLRTPKSPKVPGRVLGRVPGKRGLLGGLLGAMLGGRFL